MADITLLARLINGAVRNVDISANTPVVLSIKIGGLSSNTELTKTILDNLILMQNGSDISATLHHHDGRYFTESELQSATAPAGSSLIGDNNTYTNFTPTAATVKGALQGIDAALSTAGNQKPDNVFRIVDDGDNTKQIAFEASNIATGTTRTITMPNHDVNLGDLLNRDGSISLTGNLNAGGNKIVNLSAPTAASDAATKAYVDSMAEGLKPKAAVRAATTANITLSGLQTIDGVSLAAGNRVLVKDQTAAEDNGIYIVSASAWSRAPDFDSLSPIDEINGAIVAVQEGTANAGKIFVQTGNVTAIGTDAINFVFFNAVSGLIGGNGITITGSNIEVDHDGQGLDFVAGQLALELDGTTLSKSAAGLKVADSGITSTQLANSAVTTNKIDDSAVTSIKIANNAVTPAKIDSSVAGNGLTGGSGSPLSVVHAPLIRMTMVAGESFAANTTFLVRMARDSETAGRVYKADRDASSNDNFYVIGVAFSTTAVSAGQDINVIALGTHILGSGDTAFAAADVGRPVFLQSNGGFSVTPPTNQNDAVVRVGIVQNTDRIFVQPQVVGVL